MSKHIIECDDVILAQAGPDGAIHVVNPGELVQNPPRTLEDFAGSLHDCRVRVRAGADNLDLILRLYNQRSADVVTELGRHPDIPWALLDANDPGATLRCMQGRWECAPSKGGWHAMTALDFPTYAMAALLKNKEPNERLLRQHLTSHPLFPAMVFVPHLDWRVLCRLLATILDPRWLISTKHPEGMGRLKAYFGLLSSSESWPRVARRALVTDTWKTTASVPPEVRAPGYFLWRTWALAQTRALGDLGADRQFLDYLRANWLDVLRNDVAGQTDGLFVPKHFFSAPDAAAWRAAMQAPALWFKSP